MKKTNRWLYAIVGCAVLLVSGLVYAWSGLSGPIAAEFPQWSAAQLSLTFTIVMSFFCVGSLVGGLLSSKVSQKVYLWVSAALFLTGFLLTANIRSILMLYIGFGVICGFASGLSYNAVLGTVGGVLVLSGTVVDITRNYFDRRVKGKDIEPMWSAFLEYQKQEEAEAAAEEAELEKAANE